MSYPQFLGVSIIPMPAAPAPRQVTFSMTDSVGMTQSPFTMQTQVQAWPGADYWSAEVSLPPMTQAQASAWLSFFAALRGKANIFRLGDPLGRASKGVPAGSPVIDGAHLATATVINTRGWTPIGINMVSNPGGPNGWTSNSSLLFSAPGLGSNGANGWVYYGTSGPSGDLFATSSLITVTPGATYTLSGYVDARHKLNVGAPDDKPGWIVYNSAFTQVIAHAYAPREGFKGRVSVTFTVPAGITQVKLLAATRQSTIKAGRMLVLADPQLEAGTTASAYADYALLQPGDYIQIGNRLHQVVGTPIYPDAANKATIEIWPSLREPLADGTFIGIRNAQGMFRLADNTRSWSATEARLYGLSFKCVEAR